LGAQAAHCGYEGEPKDRRDSVQASKQRYSVIAKLTMTGSVQSKSQRIVVRVSAPVK
jgi:hypothetical protein